MVIAITGHRAVSERAEAAVRRAIAAEHALYPNAHWVVGGVVGVNLLALVCLGSLGVVHRTTVVLPSTLASVPIQSWYVITELKPEVVELGLDPRQEPFRWNDAILDRADRLLAFAGTQGPSGAWYTIERAKRMKIPVELVKI